MCDALHVADFSLCLTLVPFVSTQFVVITVCLKAGLETSSWTMVSWWLSHLCSSVICFQFLHFICPLKLVKYFTSSYHLQISLWFVPTGLVTVNPVK